MSHEQRTLDGLGVALDDMGKFTRAQILAMWLHMRGFSLREAEHALLQGPLTHYPEPDRLAVLNALSDIERGITYIGPTESGEGKTTRLMYLAQNLVCDRTRRLGGRP